MDCLNYKPAIAETFEKIRILSFYEKREPMFHEDRINNLLDEIIDFKKSISDKTQKLNTLVQSVEEITWLNEPDNDMLMSINDLISSIRDLFFSLNRQYLSLALLRTKGIAIEEIVLFKASIDDLKDVASDLESRYFFLPSILDFNLTTKELSLL